MLKKRLINIKRLYVFEEARMIVLLALHLFDSCPTNARVPLLHKNA